MLGNGDSGLRLSPSAASGTGEALLDRKRLLVSLLSDREAVRVICAPPLYGKTVLATQYARMAFPPGNVTWVQASEPEFLLNLDAGNFDKALEKNDSIGEKLVVFDGISKLKGKRRTSLVSLVGKLHTKNCEVMMTTEDSTLASDVELPVVVLDAREMALSNDELPAESETDVYSGLPSVEFREGSKRVMPPVVLDRKEGEKRFLRALVHHAPDSPEEALAYLALFAGNGELSLLKSLFSESSLPNLKVVERRFPYAGIRRMASMFHAFEIPNQGRYELICAQAASILPFTRFEEEPELIYACAELCLRVGNRVLLSLLLANSYLRDRFAREHGELMGGFASVFPGEVKEMRSTKPSKQRTRTKANASPVRIDLFGRCEITRDGVSVLPKGELRRKAKLVVALVLVNNGKELPRTWIERIVWPDSDPSCVRSSFYNLWSYIRHILTPPGEEPFGSRRSRDTVSFAGLNFKSDVIEVDELCRGLHGCTDAGQYRKALKEIERLYSGPLLPGIQNDQLETYRQTYQNRVLDALVDGVRILMRAGDLRVA